MHKTLSWQNLLAVIAFSLVITSCVSQKKMRYLQEGTIEPENVQTAQTTGEVKIKPFDVLHVQVYSASPELSRIPGFDISSNLGTTASIYLQGYSVGHDGKLQLPLLGTLVVEGLTIPELEEQLNVVAREKISLDADVMVRLVNFRISVLGEVKDPAVVEVFDSRISVLEALARAGDLTVYGNRKNVMLIRDNYGKKEVIYLDLTDRNLLYSPYFYLQNNDVIYVQPMNAKSYGFAQVQWSVLFSSVSTLIAILALLYK